MHKKSDRIVKKSDFTLVELLIVLFILSFGALLTGIKMKEMYQEQRFLSEGQMVLSTLAMAQDLMLIMNTDIHLKMEKKAAGKGIDLWLEIEKPLATAWAHFIQRKLTLNAVKSLAFNGKAVHELSLQFSLGSMSNGLLELFREEEEGSNPVEPFQIELPGYPCPLAKKAHNHRSEKGKQLEKNITLEEKGRLLYPEEVYEDIQKKFAI